MYEGELREAVEAVEAATLRVIDTELRQFLEHSLQSDVFWERWSQLDFGFNSFRCWEVKGCKRTDCPSFGGAEGRCWLMQGTLCGGAVQGDFAKKYRTCFECEVLKSVETDPVRAVYEHINILIHHLRKRDQRIMDLAIRDQLTGAYNRTYFAEVAERMSAQAGRYGECISLMMIDLDNFKTLNDRFGHAEGDRVLADTASLIHKNLRSSDMLFRYGGDEFLVVCPHTDCEGAGALSTRLSRAVEEWNRRARYKDFSLSLSLGCSTWRKGENLRQAISRADALMYCDKRQKKESPSGGGEEEAD